MPDLIAIVAICAPIAVYALWLNREHRRDMDRTARRMADEL